MPPRRAARTVIAAQCRGKKAQLARGPSIYGIDVSRTGEGIVETIRIGPGE